MKILVTGGNGFIGSRLCTRLREEGNFVSAFDLNFDSSRCDSSVNKIQGDVTDYEDVSKAVHGIDAVFHFGAVSRVVWGQRDPYNCWLTNVLGTLNLLDACTKNHKKTVMFYASSREVYGEAQYIPVDECHVKNPISAYGASKLSAERACLSYHSNFGLDVVILRFSNVYGSKMDQLDRVIPKFMINALKGERLVLHGGDQVLDFTYVGDVVTGILQAFNRSLNDKEISGEDFHFVSGKGTSVQDLAKMIVNLCNSSSEFVESEPKSYDVRKFIGDPSKSSRILGFHAKTSLAEGLEKLKKDLVGCDFPERP